MTLDEAIHHAKEVCSREDTDLKCKSDHEQLHGWLVELKGYREREKKEVEGKIPLQKMLSGF